MMEKIESLYLHFPFCREICNYCSFYKSIPNSSQSIRKYEDYLIGAYEHHTKLLEQLKLSVSPLKTIYLGGGTPSLWGEQGADFIGKFLKEMPFFVPSILDEFTLEVNPGTMTKEQLIYWQDIGVNRFSVGVQTLDPVLLKKLGRAHSVDDTFKLLENLKSLDASFSVDFMLGLPFSVELKRDILKELEIIQNYKAEHYSIYILTVNKSYQYFKDLPEESWIAAEYLEMSNFLENNGHFRYEVSNFSLPGKESKHNQAYWNFDPVLALGPSATGVLPLKDKEGESYLRYKWSPSEAIKFSREVLDEKKVRLEKIYLLFRQGRPFHQLEIEESFENKSDLNHFLKNLMNKNYIEKSLVKNKQKDQFVMTAKGHLHLDSVMEQLFSYKLVF